SRQRRNLTNHHNRANPRGVHPLTDQQTASALPGPPARPWPHPSKAQASPSARPRAGPQDAPTSPQRSQAPPASIPEARLLRRQQARAQTPTLAVSLQSTQSALTEASPRG